MINTKTAEDVKQKLSTRRVRLETFADAFLQNLLCLVVMIIGFVDIIISCQEDSFSGLSIILDFFVIV